MKFSESWLREWVNPSVNREELSHQITMAGLEVDGIEPVAAEFSGVIVGEVVECGQHPDADKLRVTKINVGGEELIDILADEQSNHSAGRTKDILVFFKEISIGSFSDMNSFADCVAKARQWTIQTYYSCKT